MLTSAQPLNKKLYPSTSYHQPPNPSTRASLSLLLPLPSVLNLFVTCVTMGNLYPVFKPDTWGAACQLPPSLSGLSSSWWPDPSGCISTFQTSPWALTPCITVLSPLDVVRSLAAISASSLTPSDMSKSQIFPVSIFPYLKGNVQSAWWVLRHYDPVSAHYSHLTDLTLTTPSTCIFLDIFAHLWLPDRQGKQNGPGRRREHLFIFKTQFKHHILHQFLLPESPSFVPFLYSFIHLFIIPLFIPLWLLFPIEASGLVPLTCCWPSWLPCLQKLHRNVLDLKSTGPSALRHRRLRGKFWNQRSIHPEEIMKHQDDHWIELNKAQRTSVKNKSLWKKELQIWKRGQTRVNL